jgi:hypothetical protein
LTTTTTSPSATWSTLRDVHILDNTIDDPQSHGIACVDLDQNSLSFSDNHMERVRIAGNTIRKIAHDSATGNFGFGILVGTGNVQHDAAVDSSTYRLILVEENFLHFTEAEGVPTGEPDEEVGGIRLCMAGGGRFEAPVVRDNTVIGYRAYGIRIDRPRGAVVTGNSVYDGTRGIGLWSDVRMSHLASNRVLVSEIAYALEGSAGSNVVIDNSVLGPVETLLSSGGLEDSDVVDDPRAPNEDRGRDAIHRLLDPLDVFG